MSDEVSPGYAKKPDGPNRALNEVRRVDNVKGEPSRAIPEHLRQHYHQDGNALRSAYRPEKIEIVDRGNRMHAYFPISSFTVRAIAETVAARGWKELEVTGTKQFQQSVYVEAAIRGVGVRGYTPTDKDAEVLQRRVDRKAAAENPVVQAFLSAETDKQKKAAITQHPQLKAAFAVDAEAKTFADANIDSKKSAQAFVDRTRDNIAIQIHRGQEIKLTKPTTERAEQKEPVRDQKQDQDRSR